MTGVQTCALPICAEIEVLHEGAIRRDPIAVRIDDMRVALRRRDAEDVWVRFTARADHRR